MTADTTPRHDGPTFREKLAHRLMCAALGDRAPSWAAFVRDIGEKGRAPWLRAADTAVQAARLMGENRRAERERDAAVQELGRLRVQHRSVIAGVIRDANAETERLRKAIEELGRHADICVRGDTGRRCPHCACGAAEEGRAA